MLLANMRPPIPSELAVWTFFEEHRRCGELDGGVEDGRLWMVCESGAVVVRPSAHTVALLGRRGGQ